MMTEPPSLAMKKPAIHAQRFSQRAYPSFRIKTEAKDINKTLHAHSGSLASGNRCDLEALTNVKREIPLRQIAREQKL
jgi:hypothetical protein